MRNLIEQYNKNKRNNLLHNYGIKQIGLFGSYVRGKEKAVSDIDILIDLEKPIRIDLIKLIEIEQDLSEKLDIKVEMFVGQAKKKGIGLSQKNQIQLIEKFKNDEFI